MNHPRFILGIAKSHLSTIRPHGLDPTNAGFGAYSLTGTSALTIVAPSGQLGKPLTYSPENKITINANYTLPLDEHVGKITLGATFTHTDSQHTTFNDVGIPAQIFLQDGSVGTTTDAGLIQATNLLDLYASWTNVLGSPVDLSAFVTNVTNQHYYTQINGLLGLGVETGSLGAPRIFGFRAKVHF